MESKNYPSLAEYINQVKGWYWSVDDDDIHPGHRVAAGEGPVSAKLLSGPVTVVKRADGTQALYTYSSWESVKRRLLLIRLDDDRENPYLEDPALESWITLPRSVPRRAWIIECAVCGRETIFEGYQRAAVDKARERGWKQHWIRGWMCPEHRRERSPRRRKAELARLRQQAELADQGVVTLDG